MALSGISTNSAPSLPSKLTTRFVESSLATETEIVSLSPTGTTASGIKPSTVPHTSFPVAVSLYGTHLLPASAKP